MNLNEFYTAEDVLDSVFLSKFVYDNLDKIEKNYDGLELFNFTDNDDTEFACYKQINTNHFFIAFRGSSSLKDWLTDAEFTSEFFFNTKAHKGFIEAYNETNSQLKELVSRIKEIDQDTTIFFTGHSLGAALANLAYYDFCLNSSTYGVENIEFRLITFGSPKVFRRKYTTDIHNKFFNNVIRITDGDDIVTRMPPDSLFLKKYEYTHFGQHICIGKFDHKGFLKEHRISKYIKFAQQLLVTTDTSVKEVPTTPLNDAPKEV